VWLEDWFWNDIVNISKRLSLGTAQFGLDYGVTNQDGKISLEDAGSIISYAYDSGIDSLDTAFLYGSSQKVLGIIGIDQWNVYTKLPELPHEALNCTKWVIDMVYEALSVMRVDRLKGVYLHRPNVLCGPHGEDIYKALNYLLEKKVIEGVGISIYSPAELDEMIHLFPINLVQAPFNPIDDRMITSGWINKLKEMNIELHARSIFLQGLLLAGKESIPNQFVRWNPLFRKWHEWLAEKNLSPLEACLRYALGYSQIDKVVIGVNNLSHIKEILSAVDDGFLEISGELRCQDLDLINPSHWVAS